MNYYAVHYTYVTDTDALTAERPAHRDYLRTLGQGGLLAAGNYPEADQPGALLLFKSDEIHPVEVALNKDPYWTKDLIVERRIERWNPVIGVFETK